MGLRRTPPAIAVLCILTLSHACSSSVDCASQHANGTQHLSSSSNDNVINTKTKPDYRSSDHGVDRDITAHTDFSVVSADGQQSQQHASQLPVLTLVQPSSLVSWICGHPSNAVSGYICPAVAAPRSASSANHLWQQVGHCCICLVSKEKGACT